MGWLLRLLVRVLFLDMVWPLFLCISVSHSSASNRRKHEVHLASKQVYLFLAIKLGQDQASASEMRKVIT